MAKQIYSYLFYMTAMVKYDKCIVAFDFIYKIHSQVSQFPLKTLTSSIAISLVGGLPITPSNTI